MMIRAFGETKCVSDWRRDKRCVFGLTKSSLLYRLKCGHSPEEAITKHKYKYIYNHKYFHKWTYENAWIIGFITADGNVYKNTLNIKLAQKDVCILEHIRDKISPKKKIFTRKTVGDFYSKNDQVCISMSSAEIIKDLCKYNIIPNKTGKEKLPSFPNKKIAYRYLSGLIDGDGCIGFYKIKNKTNQYDRKVVIYSSSIIFLKQIKEYFNVGSIHKCKNRNCYSLQVRKKDDLIKLYNGLYKNKGFCLQRKKHKFLEMINTCIG